MKYAKILQLGGLTLPFLALPLAAVLDPGGWCRLPDRFLDGAVVQVRLELAGQPIQLELDPRSEWEGDVMEHVVADGVTLRLRRHQTETESLVTASCLVLIEATEGVLRATVEAEVSCSPGSLPVRLSPRGRVGITHLSLEGAAAPASTGLFDPATGAAADFGEIHESLALAIDHKPEHATSRRLQVEGRLPRGREIVIFSCRRVETKSRAGSRTSGAKPPIPGTGGWILEGGKDLANAGTRLRSRGFDPSSLVEMGDGWQRKGDRGAFQKIDRTWVEGLTRDSPEGSASAGLARAAAELAAAGYEPGVWILPHGETSEDLFRDQPGVFLKKGKEPVSGGFLGRYVVDGTSAPALEYLRLVFRTLRSEGIKVFRLGGLGEALAIYTAERASLSDPSQEPLRVLEATLGAVREGAGEGAILLGGWGTPLELAPRLDGLIPTPPPNRGRSDILLSEGLAQASAFHLHRRQLEVEMLPLVSWLDEDEAALERRALESRLLLAAITGRSFLIEAAAKLPPWLEEGLRASSPAPRIQPLDLFPSERPAPFWCLALPGGGALVAVFNWESLAPATLELDPRNLGLEVAPGAGLAWFDVLQSRFVGATNRARKMWLPPSASRLFALRPLADRPVVLAAAGSPVAAAWRVEDEVWNPSRGELRLTVTFPPSRIRGNPLLLHLALPPGFVVRGARAEGGEVQFSVIGEHLALGVTSSGSARVPVLLEGAVGPPSPQGSSARPRDVSVTIDSATRKPLLAWSIDPGLASWRGLEGFVIFRNEEEVGRTEELQFLDLSAPAATRLEYSITALPGGQRSERAVLVRSAPTTVFLEEWAPLTPPEEIPSLHVRRSANGGPLSVGGRRFAHGLGTSAPFRVEYALDGSHAKLEGKVGVDDASRFQGTVQFVVIVDGVELFRSGVVRGGIAEPRPLSVPIRGARSLVLVVEDGGDGTENDFADWADLRLVSGAES